MRGRARLAELGGIGDGEALALEFGKVSPAACHKANTKPRKGAGRAHKVMVIAASPARTAIAESAGRLPDEPSSAKPYSSQSSTHGTRCASV